MTKNNQLNALLFPKNIRIGADNIFSMAKEIALPFIKKAFYSFKEFKKALRAKYTILNLVFANSELNFLQIYFYKK